MGDLYIGRFRAHVAEIVQSLTDRFPPLQASELATKGARTERRSDPPPHIDHPLVIGNADQAPFDSSRHFPYTYITWTIFEMDTPELTEKKWFVYLTDHHEGPLSLAEIRERMSAGQIDRSVHVWAEG